MTHFLTIARVRTEIIHPQQGRLRGVLMSLTERAETRRLRWLGQKAQARGKAR